MLRVSCFTPKRFSARSSASTTAWGSSHHRCMPVLDESERLYVPACHYITVQQWGDSQQWELHAVGRLHRDDPELRELIGPNIELELTSV